MRLAAPLAVLAFGLLGLAFATTQIALVLPEQSDIKVYLAAGQRLNAGLPLYATDDLGPDLAPVAIFSPPLVGAVFRLVVLLPNAAALWVSAMAVVFLAAAAYLALRAPVTVVAMAFLLPSIAMLMLVGNVDALVIAGALGAWHLFEQRRDREAGLVLGVIASLKLTPLVLIWWALMTGRSRGVVASIVTGVTLALVAVVATEPGIFLRFAEVTLANYGLPGGPLSLASLGRHVNVPFAEVLPRVALLGGFLGVVALRRRPRSAWTVAAVTMVVGSPVASVHTLALLLIALAPYRTRVGVVSPRLRHGQSRLPAQPTQ